MTLITWACLRCVQEAATILGPQNRTQGRCDQQYLGGQAQAEVAVGALGDGSVAADGVRGEAEHHVLVHALGVAVLLGPENLSMYRNIGQKCRKIEPGNRVK